jgi:hypothetical protein
MQLERPGTDNEQSRSEDPRLLFRADTGASVA